MNLTSPQQVVFDHVTAEPQTAKQIADAAGFLHRGCSTHLYALKTKGLVVKHLNPTRWVRADG